MYRLAFAMLWLLAVLACPAAPAGQTGLALAAPPGPADLSRSIETARRGIADHEKTIQGYDTEMRGTAANDPTSARRREEIRILKQHYVREIEALRAKIIDDYKKIQEFRDRGVQ
ncbi:hypothetical protein DVDV_3427 [Desulfovibrio sp. DV]|uniref:hypothetical protein n=1 Tax=Desulfovibrio sp. DV TaxID=1844708 RepID=UPI00094BB2B5|nr:hypothetical protein [Desulfovibrio sp. DV]OLN25333.1 hypothetical protein DVDV_3427 [Desulfovibrio sp. DV]